MTTIKSLASGRAIQHVVQRACGHIFATGVPWGAANNRLNLEHLYRPTKAWIKHQIDTVVNTITVGITHGQVCRIRINQRTAEIVITHRARIVAHNNVQIAQFIAQFCDAIVCMYQPNCIAHRCQFTQRNTNLIGRICKPSRWITRQRQIRCERTINLNQCTRIAVCGVCDAPQRVIVRQTDR